VGAEGVYLYMLSSSGHGSRLCPRPPGAVKRP
jgi:hypothetical protein